ncbi:hypothetical protein [Wielerella bovis]|uniref:hypothetical protein n=1 Tax=Wielerella bovis TaxID=2917790 RepID=UPI0020185705|nr:hypothetical protein [Wielerella bovis]ULJ66641.1 hypothetical protein MIS31_10390 [Wielerella bovis]
MSLNKALLGELQKERFDITQNGLIFPALSVGVQGEYFYRVNDEPVQTAKNLITAEGLTHILNVAMGTTPKPTAYYLALFAGSAAPQSNWTAANFAAVANELTSQAEGYTNATRPVWTPSVAVNNSIDNMGGGGDDVSKAVKVTIATASQLNITGAALLTAPAKGATTGALISAAKYPIARTLQNGDVFYIGYRLSLTE